MNKSVYNISQMDCPSEENLIKMRLADLSGIAHLEFDLSSRMLSVYHEAANKKITEALQSLNLGALLKETGEVAEPIVSSDASQQRQVLWIVLIINFGFFLIEITTGFISKSMGLVADSLDMLADAFVYGMSLIAVGAALAKKKQVALFSGIVQILLAVAGFSETIRRFLGLEIVPDFRTMIVISLLALIANSICLWLLQRTKSDDAHIKASVIFSANDVIINLGVILSALFVWYFESGIPDLAIGTVVFLIVIRGAVRILQLAK